MGLNQPMINNSFRFKWVKQTRIIATYMTVFSFFSIIISFSLLMIMALGIALSPYAYALQNVAAMSVAAFAGALFLCTAIAFCKE